MAETGGANLEFRVNVGGLNELGQLKSQVLKLDKGIAVLEDSAKGLTSQFPRLTGAAKELNKAFVGEAQSLKMLARNQKIFKRDIKGQVAGMKTMRGQTQRGTQAWRAYSREITKLRFDLRKLPLRKLGTDLRNVSRNATSAAKNMQWLGRQMMVGVTAPIGIALRFMMQSFESFERQFVRTKKILDISGPSADALKDKILDLSSALGASSSIVAGLTSDFAQMGKALLGGGTEDKLSDLAVEYAGLALKLEKVGEVSVEVGRDFIANLAGLIKQMDPLGDRIKQISGLLAKFNMMENTTALSLRDLAEAFPQVSPAAVAAGVDLVFLSGVMANMKEVGLDATESAHALKFSLQRMINPTAKVRNMAEDMGSRWSDFNVDLGMGNMLLFNLAENLNLINRHAGQKAAITYLGELVGKRQASRMFAAMRGMEGFTQSVAAMQRQLRKGGATGLADVIGGVENLEELEDRIKNAFATDEVINKFRQDIIEFDQGLGDASQGFDENTTTAGIMSTALQDLSPPLKSLIIDFMGATEAGKTFVDEYNLVMKGPAAVMQRMRNDIKLAMQELGATFFNSVRDTLIPAIQKLAEWLADLSPTTKQAIMVFAAFLAVLGPVAFSMGQVGNIIGSVGRVFATFLPKMKAVTMSMIVAKAAAGEKLPVLRQVGTALVETGRKAKTAASGLGNLRSTAAATMSALKHDPSISMSRYASHIVDVETVSKQSAKTVATASTAMSASAAKGATSVATSTKAASVQAEGSLTRMFRKTSGQFDRFFARIKAGSIDAKKSLRRLASAQVGKHARQPLLMKRDAGGRFTGAKFPNPAEMAVAWSRKISGVADHFADKFALSAYDAAGKMDKAFRQFREHPFKSAFKAIRLDAIISASIFRIAFMGAIKAVKVAMISSGIMAIFLILGSVIAYVVTNLDMFKEAGKKSLSTFTGALAVLKDAFVSVGKIFFDIFGEIFGGKTEKGSAKTADSMDVVGSAIQKVADIFMGFAKIVRFVMQTLLPPIIRFFLTIVKKVADRVGAALGVLGRNWTKISKTITDVVYWIVKVLEFLLDSFIVRTRILVTIVKWIGKVFFGLLEHAVVPVFKGIWFVIDGVLNFVIGSMRKLVEAVLWAVKTARPLINKIFSWVDDLGGALDKIGMGWSFDFRIADDISGIEAGADKFFDKVQQGRDGIKNFINDDLGKVVGAVGHGVDVVLDKMSEGLEAIVGFDMARKVRGALEGMFSSGLGLGEAVAEEVDENLPGALDLAFEDVNVKPLGVQIQEEISESMQNAFNTFVGKVKSRLKKELSDLVNSGMKSFDAYVSVYLSAYDTRIEAIQGVIEAEKELTKTVKYESDRRALVNKMALDTENFLRNRALALYEGRVEDARNLSVKFGLTKAKSQESISGLDKGRAAYLLDRKRQGVMDTIKDEQKLERERLKVERGKLKETLDAKLEDLPATNEELQTWLADLNTTVTTGLETAFGEDAAGATSLKEFATIIDTELGSRFREMFADIGIVSDGATLHFVTTFDNLKGTIDEKKTEVSASLTEATSDWLLKFLEFDPLEPFQRIFDLVNEEWKSSIEWDLIAQGWMTGFMDDAIPHIIEQLKIARGMIDDAMDEYTVSSAVNPEIIFANKWLQDNPQTFLESSFSEAFRAVIPQSSFREAFRAVDPFAGPDSGVYYQRYGYDPNDPRFSGRTDSDYSDFVGYGEYYGSRFNGGAIKAQYGRYLNGFRSATVPILAHGGEYVMNAKAVQNVGLSNLEAMNSERNYEGGGASGVNIYVDNFIGQPEWFEGMMSDYNVSVAPRHERSKGLDSRRISSMADNNRRGRV